MNCGKDFTDWHTLKTNLQRGDKKHFFKERDIWLCSLGLNLGCEEDGKGEKFLRPVIIFRKFSHNFFWAIPLTSQEKTRKLLLMILILSIYGLARLYQMKLIDQKRLVRKIGKLPREKFMKIKYAAIRRGSSTSHPVGMLADGRFELFAGPEDGSLGSGVEPSGSNKAPWSWLPRMQTLQRITRSMHSRGWVHSR